jgi:hypothetical protein
LILLLASVSSVHAAAPNGDDPRYQSCIDTASTAFKTNPLLIKVLIDVEGGRPGTERRNTNGTFDLGVMQVNDKVWLPTLKRFGINREALRDNACLNIFSGTYIFMTEYSRVQDIGLALANYHSKTKQHQARYLGLVSRAIERRMALARTASR